MHVTSEWMVRPLDGWCMRPVDAGRTVEPGNNWGKGQVDGRWDRFTADVLDHCTVCLMDERWVGARTVRPVDVWCMGLLLVYLYVLDRLLYLN